MKDAVRSRLQAPAFGLYALGVAGALALAGCDGSGGQAEATAPSAPEVTVAHPRVQNLVEWTEFTGRFEALQQVDVRARVSGYLATIDFQDGQIVAKGQSLFLIDPRPFEAAPPRRAIPGPGMEDAVAIRGWTWMPSSPTRSSRPWAT